MGRQDLLKKINFKPAKKVEIDFEEKEEVEYSTSHFPTKPDIPPVTAAARAAWAKTRATQSVDGNGAPVEGWAARISAMLADGRLYKVGNVIYIRDM
jgi:hypothetical protein